MVRVVMPTAVLSPLCARPLCCACCAPWDAPLQVMPRALAQASISRAASAVLEPQCMKHMQSLQVPRTSSLTAKVGAAIQRAVRSMLSSNKGPDRIAEHVAGAWTLKPCRQSLQLAGHVAGARVWLWERRASCLPCRPAAHAGGVCCCICEHMEGVCKARAAAMHCCPANHGRGACPAGLGSTS